MVLHLALIIGMLCHALAVSSSRCDDKLFFGPKHNIYTFFMILFGLFDLILLFVCQIFLLNCERENCKQKKFILKIKFPLSMRYRCSIKVKTLGRGSDSVGREVTSNTRGPRFQASHWQIFIYNIC